MSALDTRVRVAAGCVAVGLIVEWVSLRWAHPTAFFLFAIVGGLCFCAGLFSFLGALFARRG